MNRGSRTRGPWASRAQGRFNEAPIHESGKYDCLIWNRATELASMRPRFMNRGSCRPSDNLSTPSGCFNEAPIHESGKSAGTACRPRTSRRFNEAPIHESGKWAGTWTTYANRHKASMRPRFMNRGSLSGLWRRDVASQASMRPRFMNRGSDLENTRGMIVQIASMRPRFMNRGSRAPSDPGGADSQCRFNEAPIHESGKSRPTSGSRPP